MDAHREDPRDLPASQTPAEVRKDRSAAWLWIITFIYGLHVMEEFTFNWAAWANSIGLGFTWSDFYLTNAEVIVLGASAAMIGWRMPQVSLGFPALALVNGVFFHILPSVLALRPNPGALTATFLFLPVSLRIFREVLRQGIATRRQITVAFVFAALAQGFPLVLLKLKPLLAYASAGALAR
ncbi:MAG: HXXEE domain-containing protein [Polyangia bacterium]